MILRLPRRLRQNRRLFLFALGSPQLGPSFPLGAVGLVFGAVIAIAATPPLFYVATGTGGEMWGEYGKENMNSVKTVKSLGAT